MHYIFKKLFQKPRILVIVGGSKAKIKPFLKAGVKLNVNVATASFSELTFTSKSRNMRLRVEAGDLRDFSAIYIRMVGKRLEDATLVCKYAKKHGVRLVDALYKDAHLLPSSLGKSVEMMRLIENGIPLPKTIFGSIEYLKANAARELGFPLVIKSTTGKKAREVWSPESEEGFGELMDKLSQKEREGMRFFAQEFVPASERIRVFVLGGKAIAAIVRPTKWRKRFGKTEGRKMALDPIPEPDKRLAIIASKALQLDIAGVDIVRNDMTKKGYILEVNAAPSWKALAKDTGLNIEEEILKFILHKS